MSLFLRWLGIVLNEGKCYIRFLCSQRLISLEVIRVLGNDRNNWSIDNGKYGRNKWWWINGPNIIRVFQFWFKKCNLNLKHKHLLSKCNKILASGKNASSIEEWERSLNWYGNIIYHAANDYFRCINRQYCRNCFT